MNRKTYWKDVRKSFSSSKGRVVSIASLMALGSFALVGLKVTTPDMQHTGTSYFTKHQTALMPFDYFQNQKISQLMRL